MFRICQTVQRRYHTPVTIKVRCQMPKFFLRVDRLVFVLFVSTLPLPVDAQPTSPTQSSSRPSQSSAAPNPGGMPNPNVPSIPSRAPAGSAASPSSEDSRVPAVPGQDVESPPSGSSPAVPDSKSGGYSLGPYRRERSGQSGGSSLPDTKLDDTKLD